MKVYVLTRSHGNEDRFEIDSVYSTKELALKACESYVKHEKNAGTQWVSTYWTCGNGWTYWIDEFELDSD